MPKRSRPSLRAGDRVVTQHGGFWQVFDLLTAGRLSRFGSCSGVGIPKTDVTVTDNTPGASPTFTSVLTGNADNNLDHREVWLYTATGFAIDLTQAPRPGVHAVAGVCSAGGQQPPSTAHVNIGTVQIPGATASDPSSYCGPPVLACPAGGFTFEVLASGDLSIKFDQFPAAGSLFNLADRERVHAIDQDNPRDATRLRRSMAFAHGWHACCGAVRVQ